MDPAFSPTLPISALHLDYMSSEYSSAGEDTDDEARNAKGSQKAVTPDTAVNPEIAKKKGKRGNRWVEMLLDRQATDSAVENDTATKKGWNEGVTEKVLEVRTPRWRSTAVGTTR